MVKLAHNSNQLHHLVSIHILQPSVSGIVASNYPLAFLHYNITKYWRDTKMCRLKTYVQYVHMLHVHVQLQKYTYKLNLQTQLAVKGVAYGLDCFLCSSR